MMNENHQLFGMLTYDLLMYDRNETYRNEMIRQAEQERLLRLARADHPRRTLARPVVAWMGRRLMAAGQHMLDRAEGAGYYDAPSVQIEQT